MKRALTCLALSVLGCSSAGHLPKTPAPDPMTRAEIAIGEATRALGADDLAEEYGDIELDRYVTSVGKRIVRHSPRASLPWTFRVLDSQRADARAYPGGRVVITRGALSVLGSEAELAGVLAHEVAHVSFHHSDSVWRPDFPATGGDDALRRSELRDADHERQADALALGYLRAAGYDSRALALALTALERTTTSELRSAEDPHPSPDARVSRLAVLMDPATGEWGRARYLAHIDGLRDGPGRHAPRLVGNRFVVPGALSLDIPAELAPVMQGSLLEAKSSNGENGLMILAFTRPGVWSRAFRDGIRSLPHTVTEVAGGPAYALAPSTSGAGVTLVDRGEILLLLVASEETRTRVLESAVPARVQNDVARIAIRRAKRTLTLDAFLDAECPDTTNLEAERLNGISPRARIRAGGLVKCLANSIAVEGRRK